MIKKKKITSEWHKQSGALKMSSLFPAEEKQRARLVERKNRHLIHARVSNVDFDIFRGVYQTSIDTELMSECVRIGPKQTFLEIGCGCGAVSLLLAQRCRSGLGVDINPEAVDTSIWNQARLGVNNVKFLESDVFENVTGKFDVLVCNPPYNVHEVNDSVERMFWDPKDEMKQKFFRDARKFLKKKR
ncbi:MAG: class I SAM-dependent methyltransferase [Limisphaerales bacterium]